MFINLISAAAANQAKALRFGRKFLAAGWQVYLSINIDAVNMVAPGAELITCPVTGKPLTELLAAFHAEGGRVLVGKECMGVVGIKPEDLPAGFEVAGFPGTEEIMSIPDLKIITW
jgi:predicted peroxiredoxin